MKTIWKKYPLLCEHFSGGDALSCGSTPQARCDSISRDKWILISSKEFTMTMLEYIKKLTYALEEEKLKPPEKGGILYEKFKEDFNMG